MTSQVNPNNIDGSFPVANRDNDSQGFRDNFTNTKLNFQYANEEISELQSKALLKSDLSGQPADNNLEDGLLYAAQVRDFSYVKVAHLNSTGTVDLDYSLAHYHNISTSGSITLSFSNLPTSGQYGYLKVQVYVTNVAHTLTLPAAVSLGISGIQGISPGTSGVANTITFAAIGYYEFGFGTYDAGTTITVFDLNRGLVNFNLASIQVGNVTATGNISGSNVITTGYVQSTGNVTGGNIVTVGVVSADSTITGGNLATGGTVNAGGTITGGNLATGGTITAGNSITGTMIVNSTIYTVATLPSPANGQRAFVSDANSTTFANLAVGSGANMMPVWSTSSNWYIG